MLSNVFKSKEQLADKHYRNGEFRRAAELYRKAKRFDEEAKCYIEMGDIDAAVEVMKGQGQLQEAAELLNSQDRYRDAVPLFEKAKSYRQAADAARKAKQWIRAGRLFEQAQMFDEAVECFFTAGETDLKLRALEKQIQWLHAQRQAGAAPGIDREIRRVELSRATVLESLKRFDEAAELLVRSGQLARAAGLFERAGLQGEAAKSYYEAGYFEKAMEAMEAEPDSVDDELKAEIYLNCSRHAEAAQIFERMERLDVAAMSYQESGNPAQAAQMWEKAGSHAQAADLFKGLKRYVDAGRNFRAAGDLINAAESYAKGREFSVAAEIFEEAEKFFQAGFFFAKAKQTEDAVRNLLNVEKIPGRSESWREYIRASLLLVPLLAEVGDLDTAEERFKFLRESGVKIPDPDWIYCRARIAEAKRQFRKAEKHYLKIEEIRPGFRDVPTRLEAVRPLASEEPKHTESDLDSGMLPPFQHHLGSDTPSEIFEISGKIQLPVEDFERLGLPFVASQRLPDPWWNQTKFYRAEDQRKQGKKILTALLPIDSITDEERLFEQALRQNSSLRQADSLKLREVLRVTGRVALVYEDFDGIPLKRKMQFEKMTAQRSINLLTQVSVALSSAHKLGFAHRWISPKTVLVDSEDRVKLVGWGLAEVLKEEHLADVPRSPEQQEQGFFGLPADLYGLGLLAVALLEPVLPRLEANRPLDYSAVRWSAEVAEAIPQSIRDLLLSCLDPDPLRRPQAAEVQAALSSFGLVPGQVLNDRYEILGDLGSGGMSRVYRARDLMLNREVAIKTVLSSSLGRSHEDEQRLLQEVNISIDLTHPNIVRVHHIGKFPGGIFVTMELLAGDSLEAVIDQAVQSKTTISAGRAQKILLGIAAALEEAHSKSIVHRDLKPGNVIVNGEQVKVLDFGIARRNDGNTAVNLTRTGEVIGSPLYMAPEQIQGKKLDGRCDLYALGVIGYTLLRRREPFLGDSPAAIVLQHINDEPEPISRFRPDLDPAWERLLERLLAKKPADRYQTAEELSQVLRALPVDN